MLTYPVIEKARALRLQYLEKFTCYLPEISADLRKKKKERTGSSYHFLHKQLQEYLAKRHTTS